MRQASLEKGTTFEAEFDLDPALYAAHGGAFPILVRSVGPVGVVVVSGLPQVEDHRMVVARAARARSPRTEHLALSTWRWGLARAAGTAVVRGTARTSRAPASSCPASQTSARCTGSPQSRCAQLQRGDVVREVLVAPLHERDEGRIEVDPLRRQPVLVPLPLALGLVRAPA